MVDRGVLLRLLPMRGCDVGRRVEHLPAGRVVSCDDRILEPECQDHSDRQSGGVRLYAHLRRRNAFACNRDQSDIHCCVNFCDFNNLIRI